MFAEYESAFQFSGGGEQGHETKGGGSAEINEVTDEAPSVRGGMPVFFGIGGGGIGGNPQKQLFVPGGLFLQSKYRNQLSDQYSALSAELAQMALGTKKQTDNNADADRNDDDATLRTIVPDVDVIPDIMHASLIRAASVPTPDELLVAATVGAAPRRTKKRV